MPWGRRFFTRSSLLKLEKHSRRSPSTMKTRLASPRFGEGGANVYSLTEKRIQDKTDIFPDTESLAAYDAAWAVFFTAQAAGGSGDFARFKQMLPQVCERMSAYCEHAVFFRFFFSFWPPAAPNRSRQRPRPRRRRPKGRAKSRICACCRRT